jgi:hypothetical protein
MLYNCVRLDVYLQVASSGLYFDSKIDTIEKMVDGSQVKKQESHYTIVSQPGDELVGFCVSEKGTGIYINSIHFYKIYYISVGRLTSAHMFRCFTFCQ